MQKKAPPKGKLYSMVKVGEEGRIVLPTEMRELFGIEPGDALLVLADRKHGIAIPVKKKTLG